MERLRYAGGEDLEIVRVDLEYDPRLADPQSNRVIWTSLTEKARKIANRGVQGQTSQSQDRRSQTDK
jgi:hypothetical protein